MMNVFKRVLSAFLILLMIPVQPAAVADETAEVIKSYYLLKYEYEGFLEPLLDAGVEEPELINYFRDIENLINANNDVGEETIENYLKSALYTAATYSVHKNVAWAVLDCYGDEFDEYNETGIVPQRLQGVYSAVIDAILRKDLPDKSVLISDYESMIDFLQKNSSKYEAYAVIEFRETLGNALGVLKNKEASQEEINEEVLILADAFETFKKAEKEITDIEPENPGDNPNVDNPDAENPGDNNQNDDNSQGDDSKDDVSGDKSNGSSLGGGSSGGGKGSFVPSLPSENTQTDINNENKTENADDLAYTDVSEEYWGYEAISFLSGMGVLNGFADGSFRPEDNVTREQFAKMIVCALKLEDKGERYSYSDADENEWYKIYLDIAASYNIMHGTGNGQFGIGENLIRQDMAIVATRIYSAGYIPKKESRNANILPFKDSSEVSEYAYDAMLQAYNLGLINGMSSEIIAPLETVTRAQAAQVIYNALKN